VPKQIHAFCYYDASLVFLIYQRPWSSGYDRRLPSDEPGFNFFCFFHEEEAKKKKKGRSHRLLNPYPKDQNPYVLTNYTMLPGRRAG
jgi:hypothetical protein